VTKQIVLIIEAFLSTAYKILSNILLSTLTALGDEISGIIGVDFDAACQLLIVYFAFIKCLRKNRNTMKLTLRKGPRLRITLVNFQLDAQNSLFIYIHLLKSSTRFEQYAAHFRSYCSKHVEGFNKCVVYK